MGASEATLLNMLNISPFSYGLIIQQVYDNGSVYSPEVLDITEDALHKRFLEVSLVNATRACWDLARKRNMTAQDAKSQFWVLDCICKDAGSVMDRLSRCRFVVPPAQINLFPTIPVCLHPTAHRDAWSQTIFIFSIYLLHLNSFKLHLYF